MSEKHLIFHPQENIGDIIEFTGLVRYIYHEIAEDDALVVIFTYSKYHNLFKKHYADLDRIRYEVLELTDDSNVNDSNILKLFLGKYRTVKNRHFFGQYDKFRLNEYKRTYDSKVKNQDLYTLYGFDNAIKYSYFRIVIDDVANNRIYRQIKSIANMNYNITSKADHVPNNYKKNAMLSMNIDAMFNSTNFFDSFSLIKRTSAIYMTDEIDDYFTMMMKYIDRSGAYTEQLENKKVFLFHKRPVSADEYPESWTLVQT